MTSINLPKPRQENASYLTTLNTIIIITTCHVGLLTVLGCIIALAELTGDIPVIW